MKLRNKIAAITAAAMLAFTGVGFAAWTFTASKEAEVADIAGKVTAAIEAQNLVIKNADKSADVSSLYIICDAPTGETGLLAGEGIYWATDALGEDPIEALTLIGSVNEDDNDIPDIEKYVGHFSMTSVAAISGEWVEMEAASLSADVTSEDKDSDVEYIWNLPALSYAKVPASVAEVDELQAEVNALNIDFVFNFNVQELA